MLLQSTREETGKEMGRGTSSEEACLRADLLQESRQEEAEKMDSGETVRVRTPWKVFLEPQEMSASVSSPHLSLKVHDHL